jgi:ribosomal protein L16 Arg81 hydroxylase
MLGISPETLAGSYWDQAPMMTSGGGQAVVERFDAAALKAAVRQPGIPASRVVVKGFLGPVDVVREDGVLDSEGVFQRVYEQDHALVLNGAHEYLESVANMAREFERDQGCLVRSNVYRTVAGTFAYPLHWDTHGLVVIQLSGSKKWDLYAPVYERPVRGQIMGQVVSPEVDMSSPTQTVELQAGDVLYLPRGWGHRVITTGEESVHITFGFHPKTEHDLLDIAMRQVHAELAADSRFRAYAQGESKLAEEAGRRLVAAMETARSDCESASRRIMTGVDRSVYTLQAPHFFVVPEPALGTARIGLGTVAQDHHEHVTVSLLAGVVMGVFNQSSGWSADALAKKMSLDVKLIDELLLELVQKDLVLAPTQENPNDNAKLVRP